jgi:hypothetical protein
MRNLAIAIGLLGVFAVAPGIVQAQSKCDSGKLKNTGKKLFGKEKVHSKAFKKNEAPDGAKLTKATTKFSDKCAKDETRGDCTATGNCAALEALADGCVTAINDEIANPGAESKCDSAKAKEAGKKYFCILKVHSKAAKKNEAPDAGKLAKCVTKFGDKCAKAESKGDCSSPGNCAALEALVDGCVSDTQDEVGSMATTTTTTTTSTSSTTTTTSDCDCCSGFDQLSFTTSLAVGDCGRRGNFRCSNDANTACVTNAECDLGSCIDPPGICSGDFGVTCSGAATPCTGTCNQVGGYTPLVCGGLYTGGGGNSVPLPLPVPDMGNSFTKVTSCNGGTGELTLGATTPTDTGSDRNCTQGRTCSGGSTNPGTACVLDSDCPGGSCDVNCLFGPPLPIPNSNSTPTSVCVINVPDEATSGAVGGTAQCDGGDTSLNLPLRSVIHLAGDILSTSVGPFDVPGIQACPLCTAQCVGGANVDQPCEDNSDCPGSTCDGTPNCIGGPSDTASCTPGSSGPSDLDVGFPTSHDCPPQPSQSITDAIGGLPVALALTSGTSTLIGVDQPEGRRTFCGYCRDVSVEGSNCFDGDPDPGMVQGCPDSSAQANCDPDSGTTTGCGNAVACSDDSGCTAPYESCTQRNPGAFSNGATTVIETFGETDGACLGDGALHSANVVSTFCIPPTFDATVDAAGDLPGPGATMLQGDAQLVP